MRYPELLVFRIVIISYTVSWLSSDPPSYNHRCRRTPSPFANNAAYILSISFLFIRYLFLKRLKGVQGCLENLSYGDHGVGRIYRRS